MKCDNKKRCHTPKTIVDKEVLRVICTTCKHQFYIRKEPIKDVPLNKQYSKIFKKDILQGNDNLFYKYYPQYLQQ